MVKWIPEDDVSMLGGPPVEWVGQAVTPPPSSGKLTNFEMISLAGVVINAIFLGVSLWNLSKKGQMS